MLFLKHTIYENGIALEIVSRQRHQNMDDTTKHMIAFVQKAMRMSITNKQHNWVKLLPKIQFSINSTPSFSILH